MCQITPPGTTIKSLRGYEFSFVREITPQAEAPDIYIVDNNTSREIREQLPFNVPSFYFPVQKLNDENAEEYLDALYGAIIKDHTIFTRKYTFIDEASLPTEYGNFVMFGFQGRTNGKTVLGLRTLELPSVPVVRTHSMCYTGDIFHSLKCDCREELENALRYIQSEGGMLIYALEEGRGIGVLNKITVYKSQHEGYDTVDAQYINGHPNDLRNYDYLKDILEHYRVSVGRLITNNPQKELAFEMAGVSLQDSIKLPSTVNDYNRGYLETKMVKNNHNFIQELGDLR